MRCSTQARWQSPARPLTLGSVIDDANFFGYTGFSAALPVGNQADLSFCEYLEVIIGISRDPTYGPVIVFGLGGTMVEVLRDVVFRALPVTAADAQEMVNGLRYRAVLDGVRGAEAMDKPALCALLRRCQTLHVRIRRLLKSI